MRISDWSSDVCSSDLRGLHRGRAGVAEQVEETAAARLAEDALAQRTVVEEQAGVEVVEQVHPQPRLAFTHDEAFTARAEAGARLRVLDRKSTRLNSSPLCAPRMPSSA